MAAAHRLSRSRANCFQGISNLGATSSGTKRLLPVLSTRNWLRLVVPIITNLRLSLVGSDA